MLYLMSNKNRVIEMMTSNFHKIGWGALAAAMLAAGCVNEDPVYIEPTVPETTETGYLTMSAIGLYVVADSETDQETEQHPTAALHTRADGAQTDTNTGITRGSEALQEDEYRVTIRSRDAAEPVFYGTYAQLKSAMAAHEKGLEVPVGVYDISATSNLSDAGAPDDVQASPSYAGSVEGVSVGKDAETRVGTVVCKLQNIKITVGVAADLYEQLAVLDPERDPANKIDARVYYGETANPSVEWKVPTDWDWTAEHADAVYFPVLHEKHNTLYFSFRARTLDGKVMQMTKEISGVLQGQWRRIHVIPRYDTTGNLTFDVTISAFVQENEIVVGDDGTTKMWRELAYVDPDDPSMAAPSLKWADGSALPETIEVGSTPVQAVTIDAPNTIERVGLTFRSTHPDFAADTAAMTVEDLCAVSRNTLLSAYGIPFGDALKGQTAVTFALDGILKEIRDYAGEYTFAFAVTDCAGFTCEQTLRFLCGDGGGAAAPTIVWETGRLYDDDGYRADGTPIAGAPFVELEEGMEIVLQLKADPHFESIHLKITSEVLTAELLAEAKLSTEFDLCDLKDFEYDGDIKTAEEQASMLTENLKLIDKVNDELKQESTAAFDITGFVPLLQMLGENGGEKFQFALTVTDAGGRSTTKYLRLQNPAE